MKNKTGAGVFLLSLLGSMACPAAVQAKLSLDLGGYTRGYALYAAQESAGGANRFEFRRDSELHITGRKTLDNQTIAGFHNELKTGAAGGATAVNEIHFYFMGDWGRVNLGQEDGAAYLLQVTAPSADDNIDGFRAQINGLNNFALTGALDYDHADFTRTERVTYITPKFNGFQLGLSYAPSAAVFGRDTDGMTTDALERFENIHDAAFRWDGAVGDIRLGLGAGYSEGLETTGLMADRETWNTGLHVSYRAFSAGLAYLTSNQARINDAEIETWVAGLGWDQDAYHAGMSYLVKDDADPSVATGRRLTLGGGYEISDGISFRASIATGQDQALAQNEYTQFSIGTEIDF